MNRHHFAVVAVAKVIAERAITKGHVLPQTERVIHYAFGPQFDDCPTAELKAAMDDAHTELTRHYQSTRAGRFADQHGVV